VLLQHFETEELFMDEYSNIRLPLSVISRIRASARLAAMVDGRKVTNGEAVVRALDPMDRENRARLHRLSVEDNPVVDNPPTRVVPPGVLEWLDKH
jgi:hypothetical protein